MAFPASPSNNDVHKEGNRAFVWDSTLGVWDQVKEAQEWGTLPNNPFSAGVILQVKQATTSAQISKSDTSEFTITSLVITPRSVTSSFLVHGIVMGVQQGSTGAARLDVKLYRSSTAIHVSAANFYDIEASESNRHGGFSIDKLDSPESISEITYYLKGGWAGHSSPSYTNKDGNSGNSSLTVMEIAG